MTPNTARPLRPRQRVDDREGGKARGEARPPTPCDDWDVRTLMNHMLETQRYFLGSARGEDVSPPLAHAAARWRRPGADFERARADDDRTYGEPGVIEKTGPSLGIAFSDQLLHGWDLAKATAQDATMPAGPARGGLRDDPRPVHR